MAFSGLDRLSALDLFLAEGAAVGHDTTVYCLLSPVIVCIRCYCLGLDHMNRGGVLVTFVWLV